MRSSRYWTAPAPIAPGPASFTRPSTLGSATPFQVSVPPPGRIVTSYSPGSASTSQCPSLSLPQPAFGPRQSWRVRTVRGSCDVPSRIRGGAFRARFGRVAVQQIAPFLIDVGEGSALVMSGRRHPVRTVGERVVP